LQSEARLKDLAVVVDPPVWIIRIALNISPCFHLKWKIIVCYSIYRIINTLGFTVIFILKSSVRMLIFVLFPGKNIFVLFCKHFLNKPVLQKFI
jgi:hypothetical protein